MSDTPIELSRDELLKAGGASLLAALAMLASREADAAEPTSRTVPSGSPILTGTPIGLDFTQSATARVKRGHRTTKAFTFTGITKLVIYTDPGTTFSPAPAYTFSFADPYLNGSIDSKPVGKNLHLQTIYIAIWT